MSACHTFLENAGGLPTGFAHCAQSHATWQKPQQAFQFIVCFPRPPFLIIFNKTGKCIVYLIFEQEAEKLIIKMKK